MPSVAIPRADRLTFIGSLLLVAHLLQSGRIKPSDVPLLQLPEWPGRGAANLREAARRAVSQLSDEAIRAWLATEFQPCPRPGEHPVVIAEMRNPEYRGMLAIECLRQLCHRYSLGGESHGRSLDARLLEAAMRVLCARLLPTATLTIGYDSLSQLAHMTEHAGWEEWRAACVPRRQLEFEFGDDDGT